MENISEETASLQEDSSPVRDPLRFKIKLDIGEDAYAFLRIKNNLSILFDVGGAVGTGSAIASSSAVASTFFSGSHFLSLIGLGAASTPVGWVIAAGLLSGGAYYGVLNVMNKAKNATVTTIPNHINTPLDLLAAGLANLIFPLAIAIACADREFHDKELRFLVRHFVDEWGYEPKYVEARLSHYRENLAAISVEAAALELASFLTSNPDCNVKTMAKSVSELLHDIAASDGHYLEVEKIYISYIERILTEKARNSNAIASMLPKGSGERIRSSLKEVSEKIKSSASRLRK